MARRSKDVPGARTRQRPGWRQRILPQFHDEGPYPGIDAWRKSLLLHSRWTTQPDAFLQGPRKLADGCVRVVGRGRRRVQPEPPGPLDHELADGDGVQVKILQQPVILVDRIWRK